MPSAAGEREACGTAGAGALRRRRHPDYRVGMEIAGLPLHPLVVHAAVVLTPLAAALVVAYAVLPRHRWATRWPAVGFTLAALASVWVARLSGLSLLESRTGLEQIIGTHRQRGEVLSLVMVLFTVLVLVAARLLGGPSALASGAGARESRSATVDRSLTVALVAGSVLVLVGVVLAGDAGARLVWG